MTYDQILGLRAQLVQAERRSPEAKRLFAQEQEYLVAPEGISVIVPVHNGAAEMDDLLLSLRNQTLDPARYEVIFVLNGCDDGSHVKVGEFAASSGVSTVVLELPVANVARARNEALQKARFRLATFVDHDDFLSRAYLEECVALGDYRSVVVSNILKIENGEPVEDYAQTVVSRGFETSYVHAPRDISICYRAYTLNAIKTAPTYMLRQVSYDEDLHHSEDVKYWRDVFHAFTPITVKSPTRRDLYYRRVTATSLSRNLPDYDSKAAPRLTILQRIEAEASRFRCDSPQRKFDAELKNLLLETLSDLRKG